MKCELEKCVRLCFWSLGIEQKSALIVSSKFILATLVMPTMKKLRSTELEIAASKG